MITVKRAFATLSASALLAVGVAAPATAQVQDGLVNVAIGDISVLNNANIGVAAQVAANVCGVKVGPVAVLARTVDRSGDTATVCPTPPGPGTRRQNPAGAVVCVWVGARPPNGRALVVAADRAAPAARRRRAVSVGAARGVPRARTGGGRVATRPVVLLEVVRRMNGSPQMTSRPLTRWWRRAVSGRGARGVGAPRSTATSPPRPSYPVERRRA